MSYCYCRHGVVVSIYIVPFLSIVSKLTNIDRTTEVKTVLFKRQAGRKLISEELSLEIMNRSRGVHVWDVGPEAPCIS